MFIQALLLGGAGYLGYKYYTKNMSSSAPREAPGNRVRDAGPDAMATPPEREWTELDQELDESFPASDPPANY